MATEQLTLIWSSELVQEGGGAVRLVARQPLSHMGCAQAAKILGVSEWTVTDLFREGFINGFKPGSRALRKDGRGSNAKLRLDSGSVLEYKAAREREALAWQAAR